jgi:hypothetical protein
VLQRSGNVIIEAAIMEPLETPTITSFVIRFVQNPSGAQREHPVLRGTIHHVQTYQEIPFTHWEDALEFIRRFAPLLIRPASLYPPIEGEHEA